MAQFFSDRQIRRYLTQTIRVFSNFVVKYGDGTLVRVPVLYGDPDRQAASIISQNSENALSACPRIAIYVTGLDLDTSRLADSTFVGKMHVREREIIDGQYTQGQGRNYTVERIMPTPFKLTMKVDIWAASTEQKLQILEQILVFFNPSLELQTTDNYLDWTSLSVLNLTGVNWSSRSVPVGASSPIDIATLTVDTPIWVSPPAKVKHLGVITNIITSLYRDSSSDSGNYIDGLGMPLTDGTTTVSTLLSRDNVTISDYHISVYSNTVTLLEATENSLPREVTLEIPVRQGTGPTWTELFDQYPGQYKAGSSAIYLVQPNGTEVVGTVAINPLNETTLTVTWDQDTLNTNTGIDSQGRLDTDAGYDPDNSYRTRSPGTFDAIIDPQKVYPGHGMQDVVAGDRFLIVEDIGDLANSDGPDAWKSTGGADFYAKANDIIEWSGSQWNVIFEAAQEPDTLIYQTNIYTGVQYMWNGVYWAKAFEGDYPKGQWRIEL